MSNHHVESPPPPAVIQSIDNLPSEILGELFKSFVKSKQDLLIITGVCSKWRDVAHITPQLWTDISSKITPDTPSNKVDWVKSWLERSGGLPINIKLLFDTGENSALEFLLAKVAFGLIEAIREKKNITRCHTLILTGPSSILSKFGGNGEGASTLNTLNLCSTAVEDSIALVKPFNFGTDVAPVHLGINDIRLRSLDIQWSNLTLLHAYGLYFDELLDVLRLAPVLKECITPDLEPTRNPTHLTSNEVVTNSKLCTLRVCFQDDLWDTEDLAYFFRMINMCNLTNLDCDFSENGIPGDALSGFIRRSKCSLEILRIRSNGCEYPVQWGNDIINIAMATPKLVRLCLDEMPLFDLDSDVFLRRLCLDPTFRAIPPNEEPILPLLQSLDLNLRVPFPWELLPGIFATSSGTQPAFKRPLREVGITIHPEYHADRVDLVSIRRNFNRNTWDELHKLVKIKAALLKDWATYNMVVDILNRLPPDVLCLEVDVGKYEFDDLLHASRRYLELTNGGMA